MFARLFESEEGVGAGKLGNALDKHVKTRSEHMDCEGRRSQWCISNYHLILDYPWRNSLRALGQRGGYRRRTADSFWMKAYSEEDLPPLYRLYYSEP